MSLDVATVTLPYRFLAQKSFGQEWELWLDDGTPEGSPDDASDVTAVQVTAELQVARGETPPAAKVWTLETGASLTSSTIDEQTVWALAIEEPTGLDAGTYRVLASMTRAEGQTDWVLEAVFEMVEQP